MSRKLLLVYYKNASITRCYVVNGPAPKEYLLSVGAGDLPIDAQDRRGGKNCAATDGLWSAIVHLQSALFLVSILDKMVSKCTI